MELHTPTTLLEHNDHLTKRDQRSARLVRGVAGDTIQIIEYVLERRHVRPFGSHMQIITGGILGG